MLKSSKGITLVALVITIIVLLILAGVTLSILFSTGILDNAQHAVNLYNEKATQEMDDTNNKLNDIIYHYLENYHATNA